MKKELAVFLGAFAMLSANVTHAAGDHKAHAAGDHSDHASGEHKDHSKGEHKPRYGGIVVELKDIQYELVARSNSLQIYVSVHSKPIKIDGASARVTLLTGTEKQEVELKPAGDKLEATGSFKVAPGTKAVAQVSLPGKGKASPNYILK